MTLALDAPLSLLVRDFRELRARGEPLVLATIVDTAGSTYRKPGARMLIAADGRIFGLLSGGCLEQDLAGYAREVLQSGTAKLSSYDMRGPDDLIFGLGAGCEGAMRILLQRVGPAEGWQPLEALAAALESRGTQAIATVIESAEATLPCGACFWSGGASHGQAEPAALAAARAAVAATGMARLVDLDQPPLQAFVAPVIAPPALLLLGAGPDAVPIAQLAAGLGLQVTVLDHRPAYAEPSRFPGCRVHCVDFDAVSSLLDLADYQAAVVMSHYLPADAAYLRALAAAGPAYVGLLGPAARRERLLADLGGTAAGLAGRLRGPVGLDIGARTPEAIAVAVVAEIHAVLAGRGGAPFSQTADAAANAT